MEKPKRRRVEIPMDDDVIEAGSSSEEDEVTVEKFELSEGCSEFEEAVMRRFDRLDRQADRNEARFNRKMDYLEKKIDKNTGTLRGHDIEIEVLKGDVECLRGEIKKLKVTAKTIEKRVVNNEQMALKDPLSVDGIPEADEEPQAELIEKVIGYIVNNTGYQLINNAIQRCFRVGKKPEVDTENPEVTPRPRAVRIKFAWMRDRDTVWGDRFKYVKKEKLYWNEQFPREIEMKRRELYPIAKLIKKIPKYEKICSIQGDRLIVDGKPYTSETLHTLPEDINFQELYTKKEGDVCYFYRWRSPLSNHYPANFNLDKVDYSSAEQYYFAQMAIECHDDGALGTIMDTKDPVKQKEAGKAIRRVPKTWTDKRIDVMKKGVRAKVLQNVTVREFLKSTQQLKLAEASPGDGYWGIKMGMNHPNRKNQKAWGHNNLGLILEEIRQELNA